MIRITRDELEELTAEINRLCNPAKTAPQPGLYRLQKTYNGIWLITEKFTAEHPSGIVSPILTNRQMFYWLRAFLKGIDIGRGL